MLVKSASDKTVKEGLSVIVSWSWQWGGGVGCPWLWYWHLEWVCGNWYNMQKVIHRYRYITARSMRLWISTHHNTERGGGSQRILSIRYSNSLLYIKSRKLIYKPGDIVCVMGLQIIPLETKLYVEGDGYAVADIRKAHQGKPDRFSYGFLHEGDYLWCEGCVGIYTGLNEYWFEKMLNNLQNLVS